MDSELRTQANPKWISGTRQGRSVVDSRESLLVWEHRFYPVWYFPSRDVDPALVDDGGAETTALDDYLKVRWDSVDAWFEEDVEVFVHPRSPEVRIDALPSSRHVRVIVDDTVVADSHRPTVLFETGLRPRYYLPKRDVRMDLLTPTDRSTACPYKGWACYWTLVVGATTHDNIAWSYPTPLPESAPIANLVCFYDERVDVEVDGVVAQ